MELLKRKNVEVLPIVQSRNVLEVFMIYVQPTESKDVFNKGNDLEVM